RSGDDCAACKDRGIQFGGNARFSTEDFVRHLRESRRTGRFLQKYDVRHVTLEIGRTTQTQLAVERDYAKRRSGRTLFRQERTCQAVQFFSEHKNVSEPQ